MVQLQRCHPVKLFAHLFADTCSVIWLFSFRMTDNTSNNCLPFNIDIKKQYETYMKMSIMNVKNVPMCVHSLIAGKSLTESFGALRLFPKAMLRLTASGEKTGQLGEMLSRAADYYERETDSEITTLTPLVEPVIIIVMGVVVAFILVAMYLPLFDLVGTL